MNYLLALLRSVVGHLFPDSVGIWAQVRSGCGLRSFCGGEREWYLSDDEDARGARSTDGALASAAERRAPRLSHARPCTLSRGHPPLYATKENRKTS